MDTWSTVCGVTTTDLPKRFLNSIWKRQLPQSDDYCFIARKDWDSGRFTSYPIPFPFTHLPPFSLTDLYFCPNTFSTEHRVRLDATGGSWLFADLDEVSPDDLEFPPTLAWETSPGRFQCMWLLTRHLPPRRLEVLNKKMTYHCGADLGGWSLTKVLRLPGTLSTKYETPFCVRLTNTDKLTYSPTSLESLLSSPTPNRHPRLPSRPKASEMPSHASVRRYTKHKLPVRARQLLNTKNVIGSDDRSARLWELETLLIDAGLTAKQTLVLVRPTVWNKYAGQNRELDALWTEIQKVRVNRAKPKAQKKSVYVREPPKPAIDLMTKRIVPTDWLVERFWVEKAHGGIFGEFKAFKTVMALEMSISIVTGIPFLGKFAIPHVGPVLYVFDEGTEFDIKTHLNSLCNNKHILNPQGLHVWNSPRLNLQDRKDRKELVKHVKNIQPSMVFLDPFYKMSGYANLSDETVIQPILDFVTDMAGEYDTAVALSHHMRKSQPNLDTRDLESVQGSVVFAKWFSSSISVRRRLLRGETTNSVNLKCEHRAKGDYKSTVGVTWNERRRTIEFDHDMPEEEKEKETQADKYIDYLANRLTPPSVAQMAKDFGVSYSFLSRRMKNSEIFDVRERKVFLQ